MMLSSSIHLPANDKFSFFLWLNKESFILYKYHIFLILSSMGHIGCFHRWDMWIVLQ
jgi:hypothetical protein